MTIVIAVDESLGWLVMWIGGSS